LRYLKPARAGVGSIGLLATQQEIDMYRKILVPIDGSATAQRGLDEAFALAKKLDSALVLLHVVESYPMMVEMATTTVWEQMWADLRAHGKTVLDRAHETAKSQGIASECLLEDAVATRVCDVIVKQARDHHCDLIVMGTHGRRGLDHALMGSDAEGVARLSPMPLLLVRSGDQN